MPWTQRGYSKRRVDQAGADLVGPRDDPQRETFRSLESFERYLESLDVVNNWRSCHAFPLNTFQTGLRSLARRVDSSTLVAQRIKRLSSIELKLRRFPTMTLSQMQDLGGCRAVVSTAENVLRVAKLYEQGRMKHKLHTKDNYIEVPKPSGYRGIHLIYRYVSDKNNTYNGQKIEIQLRSNLQHSWATAVETVGTLTHHALKSSAGPDQWLRFFALMGSANAFLEGTNTVPGTPNNSGELLSELREISSYLDVINKLTVYSKGITQVNENLAKGSQYFLLQLDSAMGTTSVTGFSQNELADANAQYLEIEKESKEKPSRDAVLVSVENIANLRRAYPNYFLDMAGFVALTKSVVRRRSLRRSLFSQQR